MILEAGLGSEVSFQRWKIGMVKCPTCQIRPFGVSIDLSKPSWTHTVKAYRQTDMDGPKVVTHYSTRDPFFLSYFESICRLDSCL